MSFVFSEEAQREASRLIIKAGKMLLQHGAESHIVGSNCVRLGKALGLDSVEVSLSASSMVVTTLTNEHCVTTARRCPDRGINMHVVCEVQKLIRSCEQKRLDLETLHDQLEAVQACRHNRWLVMFMIGLSCASFCRLGGGDWILFGWTFLASSIGMLVRQEIAHRHFNPILNFGVTAFVTTIISAQAVIYDFGNNPTLVMASSVLMLVPGFPLINAISDMVKGYSNMGVARWVFATMLGFSTCIGIIAAMAVSGVWIWI